MRPTRRNTAYRSLLLLLSTSALCPGPAVAQVPPYVWGLCQNPDDPGCSDYFGESPAATCGSDVAYYPGATITGLYLGKNTPGLVVWKCAFYWFGGNYVDDVVPYCPRGVTYDNAYATNACSDPPEPKNQGDNCDTGPTGGDPLTICSGNKFEQGVDFRTAGDKNVLAFIRYYNSQAQTNGMLGANWQSNWERTLILDSGSPPTTITAVRADGQQLTFDYSGSAYTTDTDVTYTLAISGSNYTLTDVAGTVETYDSDGNLLTVAFADGYTQTLHYTSGQLTSVSDNQSRALTFTYNTDGSLQTMTDPGSNVYHYYYASAYSFDYSTVDELVSVSDPLSHRVTYVYENSTFPTYLTGVIDELGNRFATWTYDTGGKATASVLAGNADTTSITYNGDGTKTVSFPLGEEITYAFDSVEGAPKIASENRLADGSLPAATQTFTYDANGFLDSRTDWDGNETDFVNNSRGMPTTIVEASGSGVGRTTTITWGSTTVTYDKPTEIDTARNTTTFSYDSHGNLTGRTVIDATTTTIPYSTNGQKHVNTYTYDSLGHRLTATDPLGNLTTYTYDGSGNLSTIKDPLGHVTTLTNYNGRGQPQAITDPNGVVTSLSYDARGRLLTRTVSPSGGDAITTFAYDAVGDLTTLTLADGSALSYGYDKAHRLTSVKDSANDVITYTLDYLGNVTQEQISNPSGTLVKTQSRVYDDIGRLLAVVGASSQRTTYSYDSQGNITSIKDALGNSTSQGFDALNRLITVTDPLPHTTTTAYDSQDNRTSVKDPRSLITSYVYDGFGQVIQEVSPDRGTTVYVRDKAGNVTSKTDARSYVTSYSYDALNRVVTQVYPAYSAENMTFTYDATSGGNKGIGRLTGYTDESGITTLTYDERGNVTVKSRTINGFVYTTSYAYDKADHVTQETYPSGRLVTYVYDSAGRVGTVTTKYSGTTTTLASGIAWEPFGPVAVVDYGNGVVGTHAFDQDYRMTTITAASGGLNVQNLTLAYDGVDDITSITDHLDSTRTQTFTYDKDYRLASAHNANYGANITYTYDADGNRTFRNTGQVTTYTYPGTSNWVTETDKGTAVRTFTYTASGSTSTDSRTGGTSGILFGYGARDLMHAITINSVLTSTSQYTALGERVEKWVKSVATTDYHYDEHGHLIAESNGTTGAMTKEYVWLGDMQLATMDSGGNVFYVHTDQIGTPQKVTSATPTIVWDRIVQPYGEAYSLTGTLTYNLGAFPGQYYDAESNLYYNMHRTYDQTLPRYITADPIGLARTTPAQMNLYGYAGQNPIRFTDPTGLQAIPFPPVPMFPPLPPQAIPGTPENQELVRNTMGFFNSIFNDNIPDTTDKGQKQCPEPKRPDDCTEEWSHARDYCADLLSLPPASRPPGIWGGSYDRCVRGQVSQRCGGNRVE